MLRLGRWSFGRDAVACDALARESAPETVTILKLNHILQSHDLTYALFDEINARLAEQGLLMHVGTIVNADIIAALSSTKNQKIAAPRCTKPRKAINDASE